MGDGSPQTTLSLVAGDTSFQAQHQYSQVGMFVITATGVSSDGAVGSGTLDALVQAAPMRSRGAGRRGHKFVRGTTTDTTRHCHARAAS